MNEDSFHSARVLLEGKPVMAESRHLVCVCAYLGDGGKVPQSAGLGVKIFTELNF